MQFSYSQVQQYLQCPRKYAYQYIEKIEVPEENNLHFILGKTVHGTLELLYTELANGKQPTLELLLHSYQTERDEKIELLTQQYGSNRFPIEDITWFYERWVTYIEWYWTTYHPFDQQIAMATEQHVSIPLSEEFSYRWFIDRLDVDGKTMHIVDYKTNRQYPKDWDDKIKDQINLYALWIKEAYGSKIDTLIGKVIFLHLQNEVTWEITPEMHEQSKDKYFALATEILHKKVQRQAWDSDALPPLEWSHCQYCPFQQICPVFAQGFEEDSWFSLGDMKTDSIKWLIDEYAHISNQYNELKKQKDYLSKLLWTYAAQHDYARLYGNDWKLSVQKYVSYKPNKDTKDALREQLNDDGILDDVLDITHYALGRQFSSEHISYENYSHLVDKSESHSASRPSKIKEKDRERFAHRTWVSKNETE